MAEAHTRSMAVYKVVLNTNHYSYFKTKPEKRGGAIFGWIALAIDDDDATGL